MLFHEVVILLISTTTLLSALTFNATMPGALPRKADDYICTEISLPEFSERTAYVTALEARVNESLHHLILKGCKEEVTGLSATEPHDCTENCESFVLFSVAHSGGSLHLPEGSAIQIGGQSGIKSLWMETHYMSKSDVADYPTIQLTYTFEPQPKKVGILILYNAQSEIPPGRDNFVTNISCRLQSPSPIEIIAVRVHAHELGRQNVAFFRHSDDENYNLIAAGDPRAPQIFLKPSQLGTPTEPLILTNGDLLTGHCFFDSTTRNHSTRIGSTGDDEMCNIYLMYSIDQESESNPVDQICEDEMVYVDWEKEPAADPTFMSKLNLSHAHTVNGSCSDHDLKSR